MNKSLGKAAKNHRRPRIILPVIIGGLLLAGLIGFAIASGNTTSDGVATPSKTVSVANLQLPAVGGNQVALSDYVGRKVVLLYFSMGVG